MCECQMRLAERSKGSLEELGHGAECDAVAGAPSGFNLLACLIHES